MLSLAAALQKRSNQARSNRIGFLISVSPVVSASLIDAFRQGLHELGYVEGKNFVLDIRGGEGKLDRLSKLAAELVHLKVDIIVAEGMTGAALDASPGSV